MSKRMAWLGGTEVNASGLRSGGPRFKFDPKLISQTCSHYQLCQMGSRIRIVLEAVKIDFKLISNWYQIDVKWVSNEYQMCIKWVSNEYQMSIKWVTSEYQMSIKWVTNEYQMSNKWLSNEYQMCIKWVSNKILYYIIFLTNLASMSSHFGWIWLCRLGLSLVGSVRMTVGTGIDMSGRVGSGWFQEERAQDKYDVINKDPAKTSTFFHVRPLIHPSDPQFLSFKECNVM